MCAPRSLRAEQRERLRVLPWEETLPRTQCTYGLSDVACLLWASAFLLVSQIPRFQAWPQPAVTQPLQAKSPPTRVSDGRRWHRQSLPQQSTHNALAGSGAGALAGFPGRRELSVCGREASKVVCTCGGWWVGSREEKKRGETQD